MTSQAFFVCLFLSLLFKSIVVSFVLPHFDVFSDLFLNRRTSIWNPFVKDDSRAFPDSELGCNLLVQSASGCHAKFS